jgi:DNA-binding transcriptional LysR family regulator
VREDLLEEPLVLALPPRHRLARRRAVRLGDLAGDRGSRRRATA